MNLTIETPIHFKRTKAGKMTAVEGSAPKPQLAPPDPIPRVSRLMALAIHFDGMIREGVVRDYADLARLGGVTRARITQIMNLLNLAPEIQEAILFNGHTSDEKHEPECERHTRAVSSRPSWEDQRHHVNASRICEDG